MSRTFFETARAVLKETVRQAPAVAVNLKHVGERMQHAGAFMDAALDPNGPVQEVVAAVVERRFEINIGPGKVGVRIRPRAGR